MPPLRVPSPSRQSRKRLALICDSLEDNFQSALVEAGLASAAAHDVDLLVVPGGKLGEMTGKNFVHDLVPSWVDGIIVASHTIGHLATEQDLATLVERLRPVPTVTLGDVQGADCCLVVNNETAAYELTNHLLLQHHHQRLAFVSGPQGNPETSDRERGFCRALREAGIAIDDELRVVGNFTWEDGESAICELLDRRGLDLEHLDAIVCANDAMAAGACLALERRGLCIPRDVAVVGFDDTELVRHLAAPLTTVRQPLRELLFDAVRLLVEAIDDGRSPRGIHRYSADPVFRRSCGCPRLPNLPHPSTPGVCGPPGPEAIRAMEVALRDELDEEFVALLDRVSPTWLGELLEALLAQLDEQGTAFYDTIEILSFGLFRAGKPTSGWQNALLILRRHIARGGLSGADKLADLDRFVEGAMRLTSELTTSFMVRQREVLLEHLRVLSDATAGLLAAPDLGTIASVTQSSFPKLGVERGLISVFTSDYGPNVSMAPLSVFGMTEEQRQATPRATDLGPDGFLRGRNWVVEPLGTGLRPLGLAVLQCGLAHVSWYERLRDSLTAAINGAQLIQQVQHLVVTDPLTGLSNRRHLTERIRHELDAKRRSSQPLSLLVLDLDGFKALNDEHGHDEGDRALVEAGESIKRCLRDSDTLARFGGDEFVAVLPGATAEQAQVVASRVLKSLPPALREAMSVSLTCSIGIATIDGHSVTRDTELFRLADQALLVAKRNGKNRVVHASELLP
jgi:diguanylate cyclase (GGDEF)-like protein